MDLNPFGGHVNLTAQGAKLLGEEPAHSGHPNPGARQSGHSPAPFITIEGDDGKDHDAERKPLDPNPVHRLRFSISNGLGNVSDAIWNIVLANPEKAGLEGIHHVADKHIGY